MVCIVATHSKKVFEGFGILCRNDSKAWPDKDNYWGLSSPLWVFFSMETIGPIFCSFNEREWMKARREIDIGINEARSRKNKHLVLVRLTEIYGDQHLV
jgi:hypothetical protein